MALTQTGSSKERVLLMGSYGAGKSNSWADIASWGGKCHVIDLDYSADRTVEGMGRGQDNVTVYSVDGWDELVEATERATIAIQPGEWLVIDPIDKAWEWAQQGYSEKVFGKDVDQWFIEAKKSGEAIGGDYGTNWATINRMYQKFMGYVHRCKGNVMACTGIVQLVTGEGKMAEKDADTVKLFSRFGVKPAGQKNLGHSFHTILLLSEPTSDQWVVSTVRDRGRGKLSKEKMEGFVSTYLIGAAGWSL
jgi:hypothetical protein